MSGKRAAGGHPEDPGPRARRLERPQRCEPHAPERAQPPLGAFERLGQRDRGDDIDDVLSEVGDDEGDEQDVREPERPVLAPISQTHSAAVATPTRWSEGIDAQWAHGDC